MEFWCSTMDLTASSSAPEQVRLWPSIGEVKPKDWEPPVNRRKPRQFATVQMGEVRAEPFPLDFCIWLESNEFGNNRQHILLLSGARWLGENTLPNGTLGAGVRKWLNSMLLRGKQSPEENSECLQKPPGPEATLCPIKAMPKTQWLEPVGNR